MENPSFIQTISDSAIIKWMAGIIAIMGCTLTKLVARDVVRQINELKEMIEKLQKNNNGRK